MKILFANKFFFLNGGSETVFFQERNHLIKAGHKIIDFSMIDERNIDTSYSKYFIKKVNFRQCRSSREKLKRAICFVHSSEAVKKLDLLLDCEKPEIAHLHNIYHQLTPSIIPVLKNRKIKVVVSLHDYKLICPSYLALRGSKICDMCQGRNFLKPFISNCQDSRLQGLLLSIEAYWHKWKRSYEGVDIFLAPSAFIADMTAKRIDKNKIHILRNGIDTNYYQPKLYDEGYALYFGRLSREKGIITLLQAHEKLPRNFPLKIAGTGPLEDDLRKKYPKVEFLGYKDRQYLHDVVAKASFVVVPSEWYENCSMTVLESMAFGKPVIGSRVGGMPEQIEDGKTGFLFEPGDIKRLTYLMAILIEDPKLRSEMGTIAREKLENEFSLFEHNQKLLQIYKNLVEIKNQRYP